VVIIVRAAAASAFASNVNVGTRLPAHATILGRVLLSGTDDKELEALYPGPLPRVSQRSPRTLAELKKLLRQDAARGYAFSESYFEAGISAVAAPVRDHSGRIVAALSVTAQRPRLEPKERNKLGEARTARGGGPLAPAQLQDQQRDRVSVFFPFVRVRKRTFSEADSL
jgi:DNA-binding IclR family transcriptional regulator